MHRHRHAILAILALTAGLAAGETRLDEVRAFELPDAFLRLRLLDGPRLVQRFQQGAYGRLLASPTGQLLKGQLLLELRRENQAEVPIAALVDQLVAASASFAVNPSDFQQVPMCQAALAAADVGVLFGLLERFGELPPTVEGNPAVRPLDSQTNLHTIGNLLILRHRGPPVDPVRNPAPAAILNPQADLEGAFIIQPISEAYGRWLAAQDAEHRQWRQEETLFLKLMEGLDLTVTATLTDAGIRERFTCAMSGIWAEIREIGAQRPKLSKDCFIGLPGETLAAVAWSEGIEVLAVLFRELGIAEQELRQRQEIDEEWFIGAGILEAFDGPGMAYLEMVGDQVVITVQQSMSPCTGALLSRMMPMIGGEILEELVRELPRELRPLLSGPAPAGGATDERDGMARVVKAAYVDGQVIVTTHPQGVAGVTNRAGGFTQQPGVKESFAVLPPEAMILGLSNSPESWAAVGRIVARATAGELKVPLFNTLADDLRGAAKRGWLWADVTRDGQQFVIENEGLLGWSSAFGIGFLWLWSCF
jgi:hypothetical protein